MAVIVRHVVELVEETDRDNVQALLVGRNPQAQE
jgi:hypothetical protein